MEEMNRLLTEIQRAYVASNARKDKIIVFLIILMFVQAFCSLGFMYHSNCVMSDCVEICAENIDNG